MILSNSHHFKNQYAFETLLNIVYINYYSVNTFMFKRIVDYICIICDCILRYIVSKEYEASL